MQTHKFVDAADHYVRLYCNLRHKFWQPGPTTIGGLCPHCYKWVNVATIRTEAKDPVWLKQYPEAHSG